MMWHSERDCAIVYANPDKEFDRAYGVWQRAPSRNASNKNTRARWLHNGLDGGSVWATYGDGAKSAVAMHGGDRGRILWK